MPPVGRGGQNASPERLAASRSNPMYGHKYRIGELVNYTPARILTAQASSPCEIVRLLSTDGDDPQYRVKCPEEGFERVVRESELSGRDADGARGN
jgi:hypothetical protein